MPLAYLLGSPSSYDSLARAERCLASESRQQERDQPPVTLDAVAACAGAREVRPVVDAAMCTRLDVVDMLARLAAIRARIGQKHDAPVLKLDIARARPPPTRGDHAADQARVAGHVVAEDARAAPVVEQQRREDAHEGRLARPVAPEHGDALAPGDGERDAVERGGAHAPAALAAHELLGETDDVDCGHDMLLTKTKPDRDQRPRRRSATRLALAVRDAKHVVDGTTAVERAPGGLSQASTSSRNCHFVSGASPASLRPIVCWIGSDGITCCVPACMSRKSCWTLPERSPVVPEEA